ncbi:cupin [Mycobacterium intermedium]|uniref:Acireductone dioxygenase n=1 Tax=Mycobacterium intermedium TaxID=28445 RepID=A0A1E3SA49_MYCIE|nr:cupin [Mycobacterium intermedium]MCV6964245.1 cupin [Mycobacterium intermedium]ODQ99026.1 cupin [Mycobacterium intermedium]OPE46414.1 cupin [Mycobacterium intermedium]ORB05309.1 cupin [Mycobacterium intermedium]
MTLLQIMADTDATDVRLLTDDAAVIGTELARRGIAFDRWPAMPDLDAATPTTDILARYREHVAQLNADGRYKFIDVIRLQPDDGDPDWADKAAEARGKFLSEHRHAEDEVRFFVTGRGCFYLHLEPEVVAVVCEGGDLLSVPAGTRHWFDMGLRPDFVAIRFFEQQDGWIGDFTGDPIGQRFPSIDQLVAA